MSKRIDHIYAREILDSRGNPTIECTCYLSNGQSVSAGVPSGASTGTHEALELRDKNPKYYGGLGVLKAIKNINQIISPKLQGHDPIQQAAIDDLLIKLDGTPNKSSLGANAILGVSMAVAKAGAIKKAVPLYQHIAELAGNDQVLSIPTPILNIINGGQHAGMNLDFQEFIIVPNPENIPNFPDQLRSGTAIFHELKKILIKNHKSVNVGDEGGYAPKLPTNKAAIRLLKKAIELVGFKFGEHIKVGLDIAANTFLKNNKYTIKDISHPLSKDEYYQYISGICKEFKLISVEDPFDEDDWGSWSKFTKEHGNNLIIIGDDHLVTNKVRLKKSVKRQSCNAILIKPNQIGTISETIEVVNLAKRYRFATVTSHRSGETNDAFIADLAVGIGSDLVKFGGPDRGERVAKYNRLLAIYDMITKHN